MGISARPGGQEVSNTIGSPTTYFSASSNRRKPPKWQAMNRSLGKFRAMSTIICGVEFSLALP